MLLTETSDTTLFESLQKEFCPTLDSSLIAALLFEVESDVDGTPITPTSDQIQALRATLQELSLQTDEFSGIEYFSDADSTLLTQTTSSWTTPSSFAVGDNQNDETEYSTASGSSSTSFGSPLGFLQMVLPEIPSEKLKKALNAHNGEDLWDIIADIVTEEAIREMEERGLEGSEVDVDEERGREIISRKGKKTVAVRVSKKKTTKKPKKLLLADVRQQHHAQNVDPFVSRPSSSTVDPWTRISSLSSRLASLLPPHSATTFSSVLHSPQYVNSYDAVRACLASLCKSNDLSDQQATLLVNLLDIIMPEDDELDIDTRSQIISDVELAVGVTEGRADNALDLAYLLRDLDSPTGVGLNRSHSQPSSPSYSPGSSPSLSPSTLDGSLSRPSRPARPPHIPPSRHKIDAHEWKTVPSRTKYRHNLGSYVPSYSSRNLSDTNDFRLRVRRAEAKSRQALMDAAIMYQKRNNRNRGGEVALFYAERAREWKEIAKRETLDAAREIVLAKSERSGSRDVIDLHGTTVAEATVILREILNQRADLIASGKPLRIITGKGRHSVGRVSVLKPALRSALTKDGWFVTTWDAGLIVHGAPV